MDMNPDVTLGLQDVKVLSWFRPKLHVMFTGKTLEFSAIRHALFVIQGVYFEWVNERDN